jgi:hypothetical protein
MPPGPDQDAVAVKAITVWGGVGVSKWLSAIGINNWGDFAAAVASVWTVLLIADWLWKKWKKRRGRR